MKRSSFLKSLLGLFIAPSIIKDIDLETKDMWVIGLEALKSDIRYEVTIGGVVLPKDYYSFTKIGVIDVNGNVKII